MTRPQTARGAPENTKAQPGGSEGDLQVVVVVGGVDPRGASGVLRDVATATIRGARARVVGTAWTEQGGGIHEVEARPPELLRRGLALALAGGGESIAAVKIGMAVGPATAAAILAGLADYRGPVVLDPVLATSRGGALWSGRPAEMLPLARRATVVTPNASEATALAGIDVRTTDEAEAAARQLVEGQGLRAVLVKGGHLEPGADVVTDVLVTAEGCQRLRRPRAPGVSPRGTGCALATAIAVALGRGETLGRAVEEAGSWLAAAIREARTVGDERWL